MQRLKFLCSLCPYLLHSTGQSSHWSCARAALHTAQTGSSGRQEDGMGVKLWSEPADLELPRSEISLFSVCSVLSKDW